MQRYMTAAKVETGPVSRVQRSVTSQSKHTIRDGRDEIRDSRAEIRDRRAKIHDRPE